MRNDWDYGCGDLGKGRGWVGDEGDADCGASGESQQTICVQEHDEIWASKKTEHFLLSSNKTTSKRKEGNLVLITLETNYATVMMNGYFKVMTAQYSTSRSASKSFKCRVSINTKVQRHSA